MSIQEIHDTHLVYCFSEAENTEEEDKYLESLSHQVYAIELKCESYIDNQKSKQASTQDAIPKSNENAIKIERFKFPTFDGNIRSQI